jgi:F-type H+-transporting ATPase subunit gamma
MANTLSLRRRIKTAQNVSKTTRAMQMIAASKLKKSQQAALSSRPYVNKLMEIAQSLAPTSNEDSSDLHPYMQKSEVTGKTLYVIISPDKGLCGGLVTNLIREYFKLRKDEKSVFLTVGKKIEAPVASAHKNLLASFPFGTTLPTFGQVLPVVSIINDNYLNKKVDNVKLITTHFNSVFSQSPKITNLLPVTIAQLDGKDNQKTDTLFEPNQQELLPELLKRYIEMTLFQHFLESYASENAARMIAMQNATNNAKDIVWELQLLYNKARQEKITKEILDISSAAVAMEER